MHLSTLGRLALLAPALALALALPAPKDAKFFDPAEDPNVTDLGKKTGRIGIDIVDPSLLRVDPVRVFDDISRSLDKASSLTKRRDAAPLMGEREGDGSRAVRRAKVQVDPVDVDVHVVPPSPMIVPVQARGQPQNTGPTGGDMPRFRSAYDTGEWGRHY
ncbi:hypothetical protein LX32DRAFT_653840 [Colletotrichum zoysiae]|uniref:Uncharacterized protein n=1 Tax=Colletotrichum zoysiae TaxID=1216348 RepID=A0AAD9M3P9_9PEZI|nr:hypothetical protein LX32DRAFT_653840 [Colletotrichum zoysiae]